MPTSSPLVNVLPGLLLTSFGMGLLFPTAAVLATAGVAPGDRGLAGGLLAASQQAGMAVGLAVLATVAAARTRAAAGPSAAALVSGYRLSYLVGAAVTACALERPAPWPACSCCFPPPTRLKEITARSAKQNNPRFAVEIGKNLTQATRLGSEQCGRTGAPPADQDPQPSGPECPVGYRALFRPHTGGNHAQ